MAARSTEASPLLSPRTDLHDSAPSLRSSSLLLNNLVYGGPFLYLAQAGIWVFTLTLLKIVVQNPAGLFSYHPTYQVLAIFSFVQGESLPPPRVSNQPPTSIPLGILLLQPTRTASEKKKGRAWHQIFQYLGLLSLLLGTSLIIYNKAIHSAPHFASMHGKFGVATFALVITQIVAGGIMLYEPLTPLLGGLLAAKKFWKYHRMSGYVTLALLIATPALAVQSDWMVAHTGQTERIVMSAALGATAVGVAGRIRLSKWGL